MTEGPEGIERTGSRLAPLWWALLVVPLWIVLILCTHWEPVMGDGWGHAEWHRTNTLGLHEIYHFGRGIYLYENPRLGQLMTWLAYTPGPYHAIITPLIELGVFTMLTVLALGRWPSIRRSQDALVAAIVTATIAACMPQIGPILFYRPFTGNYVFGLAVNLCWLVAYRHELAAPRPARVDPTGKAPRPAGNAVGVPTPRRFASLIWRAPLIFLLGLAAGLCNEHTGFAFLAMGLAASVVALRRGHLRVWMVAGLVGLAAGYWLLLVAPGQHARYQGLADQAGVVERLTERGLVGNLRVIGILAVALLPALPLVGIGFAERRITGPGARSAGERWAWIALALGGLACALTLLGSPKIGPRLYLASIALITAGLAGWLGAQLRSAWARVSCAVLAIGALGFVEVRLVAIHRIVGPLGALRLDRIQHGAPGSVVTVPRYPYDGSRYFLGDDFEYAPGRPQSLAGGLGLKAIELEPANRESGL